MIVDVQMAVDTVPPKDLKPDVLEDPSKPYNVRHAALCQLSRISKRRAFLVFFWYRKMISGSWEV
jgi:hypothetical protein